MTGKHFDWQGRHLGTKWNDYLKSAKVRGIDFLLSKSEFMSICVLPCHYCGAEPSGAIKLKVENDNPRNSTKIRKLGQWNGIDRWDNSKGYTTENCVPCCWACNDAKGKRTETEFLAHIRRVSDFQKSRLPDDLKID